MMNQQELEFCKNNAISIEKFLSDNFELTEYTSHKNKKNRKWKIKHEEIMGFPNIIIVPIPFAYRYKELVAIGKLIIVRDGFEKYKVYINPRIIIECFKLNYLNEILENLKQNNANSSVSIEYIKRLIANTEENIRIIRHFNDGFFPDYSHSVSKNFNDSQNEISRKKTYSKNKL